MHSRVWLWYQSFSPFYPIAWQTNRRSPLGIQLKYTLRISSAFTAIKCSEYRQHVTAKRESSTSLYYFSESSENFPKQILFFSRHTIKNTQRHKFRAASSCCMSDIHFFFRGGARDWGEKEKNFSQKAGIFIGYSCSVDREKSNGKHWFVLGFIVIKIVLCLCAKASCEEGFHLLRDCSREWICNSRAEWKRKIYIHKQAKREEFNIQHVEVVNALIMKLCVDARKRY